MIKNKILTLKELIIKLDSIENRKKIVFTNGCFDIIHSGHVSYLEEASSKGDILIVALNSDDSIRRIKGNNRPINNFTNRAIVIAGLESVSYVVEFTEDTPYNLIKEINPNILVKGGDWNPKDIIGSDIVLKNGGEVFSLKFLDGFSTTNIIEKVIKVYNER